MTLLIQLRCSHTFEIATNLNPFLSQWECHQDGMQDAISVMRCSGPAVDPQALFNTHRELTNGKEITAGS
jgi:hypothetical protein